MKHLMCLFSHPRTLAPSHPRTLAPSIRQFLVWLLLLSSTFQSINAQCFAGFEPSTSSSDIPITAIRPFCTASDFTVTAGVQFANDPGSSNGCAATGADVYVIIASSAKINTRFDGSIVANVRRYYSNIQYAPIVGSPSLTSIDTMGGLQQDAIIFRFRVSLPSAPFGDTATFTFPFKFAPNFFFGDVPWRVWVSAHEPDTQGNPIQPAMPPVSPMGLYDGKMVGALNFDEPYYPIVGVQNASTHYANMTGFWSDPNKNRVHSLMLLPDANGNPAVLTVDKSLLLLGFFSDFSDRGTLLMSPGAQIKVLNGDTLAIGRVDMFTCSNQVSKGIVVEQGGRLDQENSTFMDAEVAINLKKGSKFTSFGGITCSNNYKGMRIDNSGGSGVPDIVALFGQNSAFSNTAQLKLPYTGMPLQNTTKGYGLEIISHPGISLFGGFFSNLNNGVRLYRSSFTTRATFAGIRGDAFSPVPWQGWAIWGLGLGVETLTYQNGNITALSPTNITDKGVYIQNMNVAMDRVGITANSGISLVNCKLKTVAITNILNQSKALKCRYYGIKSSNCLPLNAGSIIRDNFIVMSNPGNTGLSGTGILLGEGSKVTTKNSTGWIVQHNFLDLDRTHWGIRGLGVYNSGFYDNDVEILNNSLSNVIGVDVLNTSSFTANCNDVHTAAVEFNSRGYLFKNVNQSDYICNTTSQLSTGIEYSFGCEGTTLKGSGLNNTPTGLLLRNDVALGTQGRDGANLVQDHGNKWTTSAATHQAALPNLVDMSQFGVDPPENAAFKPASNWPNWFVDELTPTLPSFTCTGFSCLPPALAYLKDRKVETAVANGTIYNLGLPGVMPKILENHLYAELQKYPAWAAGNNLFAQFLQSKANTTTAAFWYIQQGIDALNNRTDSEQDAVGVAEANIASLRHDLYLMDSTYSSETAIDEVQYHQKLASLSAATTALQTQLDNLRSARLTQAAQLLTQNAAIATPQPWEQSEKQANDLEIHIFMQDSVTAAQLTLLDALGTLCPQTNGEGVLRAQVLYNRFVEKEFSPVCTGARGGAGDRTEDTPENASFFSVYPNPTTGILMISGLDATGCQADIFDISGQKVASVGLMDNTIDLSDLSSGIYFVRLTHPKGGQVGISKVVISK